MTEKTRNRQQLIVTIGPPAAGKSTYAKKYAAEHDIVYLSTDEARARFGYGEEDQSVSRQAFDYVRQCMVTELSQGKSVLIDATNMYPKRRKFFLDGVPVDVEKVAFLFEVPRDELLRRDALRPRSVGVEVIDMMLSKYVAPTLIEFNRIEKPNTKL
jgi:protein phosphatase